MRSNSSLTYIYLFIMLKQDRCVNIIAKCFHALLEKEKEIIGVSIIESLEAVVVVGLALKFKW